MRYRLFKRESLCFFSTQAAMLRCPLSDSDAQVGDLVFSPDGLAKRGLRPQAHHACA